jgi:hypothetical protein
VTLPPPRSPLGPERLAELLDEAVRHVTVPAGSLDRIRQGVRRRRTVHRAAGILLAAAMLAGGSAAALAVTSSGGPSRLASPWAAAAAQQRLTVGPTAAQTSTYLAAPPGTVLAQSATSSADSAAQVGQNSLGQSSVGQHSLGLPAGWDVDGDGRPDKATIVPVGNAKETSSFLLVVNLTKLGTQRVPFTAASQTDMPPHGPVIIGATDAAHDGHAEIFVQVDSSCCSEYWAIFRLVDGHIKQMTISGYPVAIAVGGSVLNNGGLSCTGPDLVIHFYDEQSGGPTVYRFQAVNDTYRWVGAALVLVSRHTTVIRGPPSDPALAKYTGVTCGGLSASSGEL